jgi:hypothetical protein
LIAFFVCRRGESCEFTILAALFFAVSSDRSIFAEADNAGALTYPRVS